MKSVRPLQWKEIVCFTNKNKRVDLKRWTREMSHYMMFLTSETSVCSTAILRVSLIDREKDIYKFVYDSPMSYTF